MKKIVGACVCALTLMGLVGQAEAAPISDWNLTVDSIELTIATDPTTGLPATGVTGGESTVSWNSMLYGSEFTTASSSTGSGTLTGEQLSIGIDSIGSLSSGESPLGEGLGVGYAFDLFTLSFTFTLASDEDSVDFGSLTYDFVFSSSYENGQETISIVGAGFQGQPTTSYKVGDYEYWIGGVDITSALFGEDSSFDNPITQLVLNNDIIGQSPFNFGATVDLGAKATTPEPATMLLMGLGLAGLGVVARRRNRK